MSLDDELLTTSADDDLRGFLTARDHDRTCGLCIGPDLKNSIDSAIKQLRTGARYLRHMFTVPYAARCIAIPRTSRVRV